MPAARVGLIGAGAIAATHLAALRALPTVSVSAVIDPNIAAAERLARTASAKPFPSLAEALEAEAVDRVHVLVPPQLHRAVAGEAVAAGLPTFVEKPLCVSQAESAELVRLAVERSAPLGVNQNFMFDPSLLRFAQELERGKYGRLRHVTALCAVPLRQLAAKQFGHWMFERPSNIVLEQLVHPLSQLVRLLGPLNVTAAVAKPPIPLAPGIDFHQAFDVTVKGNSATAQLHMAFGEAFPAWQLQCLCDDGLVVVDTQRGQIHRCGRTRFLEQSDRALITAGIGFSHIAQATGGLLRYGASQLNLVRRADPFFQSMLASIKSFHDAVDARAAPPVGGELGAHIVELCFDISRLAGVSDRAASPPANLLKAGDVVPAFDVALLGGTGFIGKATVEALVAAGFTVGVTARNMRGLPEVFHGPAVTLLRGDVTKREDVARAIGRAKYVVNLAHGGASGPRDLVVAAMVDSARAVGEICIERGVELLVHVGSIAALYLGDESETITPRTPADALGAERADYAFAKAEAERVVLALQKDKGLKATIQRPGIVVGEGASPFHSGVGLFNNEQHCMGWTNGRNALPFVLVEDCAQAIVCALKAGPAASGRTDNIVGPVRLTAREYIAALAETLGRPLKFHAGALWKMQAVEFAKWLIKRAGGGKPPPPSARDLRSRGLRARFDTAETERALNWRPETDRATFVERGVRRAALAQRVE
jgi:predicted dehydrogenase/nucleoside-diphosphate-sugar epimerase